MGFSASGCAVHSLYRVPILSCYDTKMQTGKLGDAEYRRLLEFRDGLRRFQRWSEEQARAVGLTAAQHQLLLAVRGHGSHPSIRDVAGHLMLRHHSTVELVDRAVAAGLLRRLTDETDQRVVRLELSEEGSRLLSELAEAHLEELSRHRPRIDSLWANLPAERSEVSPRER